MSKYYNLFEDIKFFENKLNKAKNENNHDDEIKYKVALDNLKRKMPKAIKEKSIDIMNCKISDEYMKCIEELGFSETEIEKSIINDYSISKLAELLYEGSLSTSLRDSYCNLLNAGRECTQIPKSIQDGRIIKIVKIVDEDKNEYVTIETHSINNLKQYYIRRYTEEDFNEIIKEAKNRVKMVASMVGEV